MKNSIDHKHGTKIRILLVCSYKIIQESLKTLIEDSRDMAVQECIDLLDDLPPSLNLQNLDTVLIYLMEGDTQAVEIVSTLLDKAPHLRVVVITSNADLCNPTRALELGAVGIVQKEQNSKMLIQAIRQTHNGETWINQQLLTKLLNNKNGKKEGSKSWNPHEADALTAREKEVIQMIGRGLKNKEIANLLFISEATVRHHLSSIYNKLGVEDRLNLVIYGYQQGLIQLPSPEKQTKSG